MRTLARRQALAALMGGSAGLLLSDRCAATEPKTRRLGIAIYALGIHQRNHWDGRHAGLAVPVAFLEECRCLGAGGIQCPFPPDDPGAALEVRRRAERYDMHVEGISELPGSEADTPRFERAVAMTRAAGAELARTVILPGRRYEQFKSVAEFREYEARGLQSLQRAEPILARHKLRLAVENHKDQLVHERLTLLKQISSEYIGLCVDVGNNFALLEDPVETVRAFAPYAMTVHIKDHDVRTCEEGFWLSDEALGRGFLDLPTIVSLLRHANPRIRFYLETITRDPIKVPVHTEPYWATFPDRPRRVMEPALKLAAERTGTKPLTQVSHLPVREQLALERRNVEESILYARERLGL